MSIKGALWYQYVLETWPYARSSCRLPVARSSTSLPPALRAPKASVLCGGPRHHTTPDSTPPSPPSCSPNASSFRGENNVFQCSGGRGAPLGEPTNCGQVTDGSGYGCFMQNLIATWREAFSGGPASENTTPSDFPFGIVSLAGGTSEGFSSNMGAFRLAQAGGTGLLPNGRKGWEKTFVAQAFDIGEPGDGAASMENVFDGQGPYASQRGAAPHTNFFSECLSSHPTCHPP